MSLAEKPIAHACINLSSYDSGTLYSPWMESSGQHAFFVGCASLLQDSWAKTRLHGELNKNHKIDSAANSLENEQAKFLPGCHTFFPLKAERSKKLYIEMRA